MPDPRRDTEKLQKVMGVTDAPWAVLTISPMEWTIMKKIFGLQRHKLLMGDRQESDVDVVGPYVCAVRRPGSNAR